jgi:hypothetical protein
MYRHAADGQVGGRREEHTEEQKDTERTETKTVSEKNKIDNIATVEVAVMFKDKTEEGEGDTEEGGK